MADCITAWDATEKDNVEYYKTSASGKYAQEFVHQGNSHLRGTKADIWEVGHRVPFIVRWPGHTPAGAVSDALIELTYLLATCAGLVGVDLPSGSGQDSRNILPSLLPPPPTASVRAFSIPHSLWGKFAIRKGSRKMIPQRGSGGFTFP
ncbi:MAG: sulfatase-like hydrolase/transferase [Planctomycetaceae bacterium]|nr:sulfatase-like hydrolase/transferase [Planctomycetales bacterium]MCB9925229.1 sulfatase-like hydrolase/transferase [Planctomycetaceae bacterium]